MHMILSVCHLCPCFWGPWACLIIKLSWVETHTQTHRQTSTENTLFDDVVKEQGEWDAAARDCTKDSLSVRASSWGRGSLQGGSRRLRDRQGLGQRHTVRHSWRHHHRHYDVKFCQIPRVIYWEIPQLITTTGGSIHGRPPHWPKVGAGRGCTKRILV